MGEESKTVERFRSALDAKTAFAHVLEWHPCADTVQVKLTDEDRKSGVWLAIKVDAHDGVEVVYKFRKEGVE